VFTLIQSRNDWSEMWQALADEPLPAVDTETTGLSWWKDQIVGASFATMTRAWYLPVRHDEANMPIEWLHEAGERLKDRLIVGHNLGGFDLHLLRREKWTVPALYHDSQIAAYTLNENQSLKLEDLASAHLGIAGDAEERQLFADLAAHYRIKGKVGKAWKARMNGLHPARVCAYAARDALSTRQLMHKLWIDLGNAGLRDVYQSLIEYDRVLHDMCEHGVTIDMEKLNAADKIVARKADEAAEEIVRQAGGAVKNPQSNPQLAKWCGTTTVDKKKLASVLKDPDVDQALPAKIELIREQKLYAKAHGTYYTAMRECADLTSDGYVLHPALRLTGAAVRLSCGRPPMQGVPRYGENTHPAYLGIKECIVAPPGRVLAEFDLSQAEVIVGAHYSQDANLLEVIRSGVSLHDLVAKQASVPRDTAKTMNFALQYGAGAAKYAELRMISLAQAREEVAAYHNAMSGQHAFYKKAQQMASYHGKVVLWSGRQRHFDDSVKLHSASNAFIQGGVSELIRVATVRIAREVPEFQMGLTVHDCVVGDLPDDQTQIREIVHEVKRIMSDFPFLNPGIKADAKIGPSWATAKHYE